jgi:hypothetical protein
VMTRIDATLKHGAGGTHDAPALLQLLGLLHVLTGCKLSAVHQWATSGIPACEVFLQSDISALPKDFPPRPHPCCARVNGAPIERCLERAGVASASIVELTALRAEWTSASLTRTNRLRT